MASFTVVVTGANRGIGRAICELLLSEPASPPMVLYATSRKGEDLGLDSSSHQTIYHRLDISKPDSISSLIHTIQTSNHTPVSILINNAGVNLDDDFNLENARRTLDVNYRGTLNICQAFLPLLASRGRIVNLSSIGSSLNPYSRDQADRFRNISSLDELEAFMREYESAVSQGNEGQAGFPERRSYSVSKACVNSFTTMLARMHPDKTINCCCPGWVNTDMGSMTGSPSKTPAEGARIPVRLAIGDVGGVSGRYWANDGVNETGEGRVQKW